MPFSSYGTIMVSITEQKSQEATTRTSKATVPSMTSSAAPCTVAAEASRATRCLTVISGSKSTREPKQMSRS